MLKSHAYTYVSISESRCEEQVELRTKETLRPERGFYAGSARLALQASEASATGQQAESA